MKRGAAGILWLSACWNAGVMVEYFLRIPAGIGLAVGIGAGLLVTIDPWHTFWSAGPPTIGPRQSARDRPVGHVHRHRAVLTQPARPSLEPDHDRELH